jgi:hypothetical protein
MRRSRAKGGSGPTTVAGVLGAILAVAVGGIVYRLSYDAAHDATSRLFGGLPKGQPENNPPALPVNPNANRPFDVDPNAKAAGPTVYLAALTPFNYEAGPWHLGIGAKGFDGTSPLVVQNKTYEYGISMHPPQKADGACRVSFVPGKEFKRFKGWVGIGDYTIEPQGSVVFTVYGDGKKLWESSGLNKSGSTTGFDIDVTGVGVLTLETRMKDGDYSFCGAIWLDPWLER